MIHKPFTQIISSSINCVLRTEVGECHRGLLAYIENKVMYYDSLTYMIPCYTLLETFGIVKFIVLVLGSIDSVASPSVAMTLAVPIFRSCLPFSRMLVYNWQPPILYNACYMVKLCLLSAFIITHFLCYYYTNINFNHPSQMCIKIL